MLFIETVEPGTLALLKELMQIDSLKKFQLVGGTALSLRLGHRMSDDLDIFSHEPFLNEEIVHALSLNFPQSFEIRSSLNNKLGVFCYIDNIKVDICRHDGVLIDDIIEEEGIRMWGLKEIAASKVNAVSRRATKKDFWDIDALLEIFSIDEIASYYRKTYEPMLAIGVARMVTYFEDANDSESPKCLKGKNWETVKTGILQKINKQLK